MIKVKHPLEHCNISQEEYLNQCPEKDRRFHELLFKNGNITYRYHNEAKEFNPTFADYEHWLSGLPDNLRKTMEKEGFNNCKTMFPFTRHVMEKNDVGIDEYVRERMGAEEFAEYKRVCLNQS